jgi:hypothetical protein
MRTRQPDVSPSASWSPLYESKAALYSAGVTALNEQIGTSTKSEYEAMRRSIDEARVSAKEARLKIERHTAEHGC